jgi:AraC-like DNA-binding protein
MRRVWPASLRWRRPPPFEMAGPLISLRSYGAARGSHAHACFQILLGLDGELELEVEGRGQRIVAGGGCVILPGARHDFESPSGSRCLVLDTAEGRWARCPQTPARPQEALRLARYLESVLPRGTPLAQQLGPRLMLDAWSTAEPHPIQRHRRAIDWPQLSSWAQRRLHEELGVATLAAEACLSPTQFAARCREETGLSVMAWLRGLRLARARQLRASGAKLHDAAQQCGYRSAGALGAALRRDQ